MYEINTIGAKYVEFIFDNIDYYNKYIKDTFDSKEKAIAKLKNKGYTIINTDCSWFYLKRYDEIDNLKKFNDAGMSFRTLILPDGIEYIKFNYDLNLNNEVY